MNKILFLFLSFTVFNVSAQSFTKADTLRGSITPERAWWDLQHYDLSVVVDIENRTIVGTNTITYRVTKPHQLMQIDLQAPMSLDKVIQDDTELTFISEAVSYTHLTLPTILRV